MPEIPELLTNPLILYITIIILLYILYKLIIKYKKLDSKYKSSAVIHGQNIEEVVPFSKYFHYDYREFKFLGMPIEGIVFGDDKITFIEIKTGQSQLSDKQKHIRELVENGKIGWEEIRI